MRSILSRSRVRPSRRRGSSRSNCGPWKLSGEDTQKYIRFGTWNDRAGRVTTQRDETSGTNPEQPPLIPCPFVYANGRACPGHVVRIELYKADLTWDADAASRWRFGFRQRSHYHLFCSEKGNHAGVRRRDPTAMKFWLDQLPGPIRRIIEQTDTVLP